MALNFKGTEINIKKLGQQNTGLTTKSNVYLFNKEEHVDDSHLILYPPLLIISTDVLPSMR